jgi:hypothetical protein
MLVTNYTLLDNPNSYEDDIFKGTLCLTQSEWTLSKDKPGTAGMFLKSILEVNNNQWFLKLSAYNSVDKVYGYESLFELIAQRVAESLHIKHLHYYLIPALVKLDNTEFETVISASKLQTTSVDERISLESFYNMYNTNNQTPVDFIFNWQDRLSSMNEYIDHEQLSTYIRQMILFDYIIFNRDRHGNNIELLYNKSREAYRIVPLFDQGCCLTSPLYNDYSQVNAKYMLNSSPVNNFIGSKDLEQNLITYCKGNIHLNKLSNYNFTNGLDKYMSPDKLEIINKMIELRWNRAVDILNS